MLKNLYKKNTFLIVGIFLFASLIFGTTYSYLATYTSTNEENLAKSGYIDLVSVSNSGNISLADAIPMSNSDGANSTPYTFTITNNGNIKYTVDIKLLASSISNSIDSHYIYIKVDNNDPVLLSDLNDSVLKSGVTLVAGASTTITLRIWLSIFTPNSQIGKSFSGSLVVVGGTENAASKVIGMATPYATTTATSGIYAVDHTTTIQVFQNTDYRYYGSNPDNYVTFNNELWRIIGAFKTDDGQYRLKIIKATSIGVYKLDNNYENYIFNTSTLNTYLNNTYYNSLSTESKNMIDEVTYYTADHDTSTIKTQNMYLYERGTDGYGYDSMRTKIGLMYPSDYGYAAGKTCVEETNLSAYNSACMSNDWLYSNSYEWTITPDIDNMNYFVVSSNGALLNVGITYLAGFGDIEYNTRPVVYLNPDTIIKSGNGTSSNPYELEYISKATKTLTKIGISTSSVKTLGANYWTTAVTDSGLYSYTENNKLNYFYRGQVNNNWVLFGGVYWRIVRIMDTGEIRMIYSGTTAPTSETQYKVTSGYSLNNEQQKVKFNLHNQNAEYVGYQYTLGSPHGKGTDSNIKNIIDTWYNNNLSSSYETNISTSTYCYDRTTYSGTFAGVNYTGTGVGSADTLFGANTRLISESLSTGGTGPQIYCSDTNDNYSLKAGLLSVDEAAIAGLRYGSANADTNNYLYGNYWLGSPDSQYGWDEYVFYVNGGSLDGYDVNNEMSVRPVITLKAPSGVVSGTTGTWDHPYQFVF